MDIHFVKKLISSFTTVVPFFLLLDILAIVLQRQFRNVSKFLVYFLLLAVCVLASPAFSDWFAANLENQHPFLKKLPPDTRYVVVLTGTDGQRLIEALRLWRQSESAILVTTITPPRGPRKIQNRFTTSYALANGVPVNRLLSVEQVSDTEDELREVAKLTGNQPIVIVSSAYHLPRINILARQYGLNATLAPADSLIKQSPWWRLSTFSLYAVDRVLHEYLGMLWYKMGGG